VLLIVLIMSSKNDREKTIVPTTAPVMLTLGNSSLGPTVRKVVSTITAIFPCATVGIEGLSTENRF